MKIFSKNSRAIVSSDGMYVNKEVLNKNYYQNIKILYKNIKDIKYVPNMTFNDEKRVVRLPFVGPSLDTLKNITLKEKKEIKNQIIQFINMLYNVNVAHRDFHVKNICWDQRQIWIIDWEYIIEHSPSSLLDHYDLTGQGEISPEKSNRMNIFNSHKYSVKNWLFPVNIEKKEFIL